MNKEELIARLNAPMEFQMVANLTAIIESNDLNIDDLLEISFHKKKEIAFRAAWMLEYMMNHRPARFSKYVNKLLALLPEQTNPSAMRHYTKIIALMTDRKADQVYKDLVKDINFEPVIEVLFTWLIDQEMLVATKVHCMQSLANLSHTLRLDQGRPGRNHRSPDGGREHCFLRKGKNGKKAIEAGIAEMSIEILFL